MTMKAVCLHFNVSDNRESMFDAESSCLPDYAVLRVDVSDIRESMCNEKSIRVNIHVCDNRELCLTPKIVGCLLMQCFVMM